MSRTCHKQVSTEFSCQWENREKSNSMFRHISKFTMAFPSYLPLLGLGSAPAFHVSDSWAPDQNKWDRGLSNKHRFHPGWGKSIVSIRLVSKGCQHNKHKMWIIKSGLNEFAAHQIVCLNQYQYWRVSVKTRCGWHLTYMLQSP